MDAWSNEEGRIAAAVIGRESSKDKVLVQSIYAPNLDSSLTSPAEYIMILLEFVSTELAQKHKS